MDFGKSFSFQFQDRDWVKKILIAALIQLIPFVGSFFVAGWGFETTRRVIRNDSEPLADWDDLINYLVKGLQIAIIGFLYALPIIMLSICISFLFIVPFTGGDPSDAVTTTAILGTTLVAFVSIIYGIFMAFMLPAAIGNFAATDQFAAAFRFGEVFRLVKSAPVAYLLALFGMILSGIIAGLGMIACGIGVLATTAYSTSINGHLQGQAYLAATTKQSTL
jgi:hypothetical protein